MAECAKKIIAKNGFAEKIHIIPKRSTEVTVGEGKVFASSNFCKI